MALKDAQIRSTHAFEKSVKRADGRGLYIEVFPNGSKLWRLKYRFGGKEKRLALGAYPEVSLADARKRRDDARAVIASGIDPGLERKKAKAATKISVENSFARVADEYIEKIQREGRAPSTVKKARWFQLLLNPTIGSMPVDKVDTQSLLAALRKIEAKGNYETAKKTRSFASRVFRYAVATGRAGADPAALLSGALTAAKPEHFAAIFDPVRLGQFLRAIEAYGGYPGTRFALRIAPHVFVRPGELRQAEWREIDFEGAVWHIPAERTKARKPHSVPLSSVVVGLLAELHEITGPEGYVFPAFHTRKRPLSENTLNAAFRRMGFSKDEVTAHGLRATASTLLNESNRWNPDAIERALSHQDKDAVRGAYHRGQYWAERVAMAEWWSNHLYGLRGGMEIAGAQMDFDRKE